MVFINQTTKQMAAKIVYFGPGLSGKTTNLKYIHSKTSSNSRGEMVSLETDSDRTLFFDLLPIDIGMIGGYKTKFQLYTVPGQVFYESTRSIVLRGLDGIVFVADSQKPMLKANLESLEKLKDTLDGFDIDVEETPMVFQYNKRDLPDILSVEELNSVLNPRNLPFFPAAAEKGEGVFETLKGITRLTLKQIKRDIEEKNAMRKKAKSAKLKVVKQKDEFSDTKPGIELEEVEEKNEVSVSNITPEVEEVGGEDTSRDVEHELLEIDHGEISSQMMENVSVAEDSSDDDVLFDDEKVAGKDLLQGGDDGDSVETGAGELDALLDTEDELDDGFDELEMELDLSEEEPEISFDRTDDEALVESKIKVKKVKVKSVDVEDVFKDLTKNSLGSLLKKKKKPRKQSAKIDLDSVGSTVALANRKSIRERANVVVPVKDFSSSSRLRIHLVLEDGDGEQTVENVFDMKLDKMKDIKELNLNLNLDVKPKE